MSGKGIEKLCDAWEITANDLSSDKKKLQWGLYKYRDWWRYYRIYHWDTALELWFFTHIMHTKWTDYNWYVGKPGHDDFE